ncbi:hypothetical protein ROZALSC1DRAFT_25422 [Rozella allomycis CSF55]|uniref:Uncharacterized protein n=1 Tax=Rozella allomycis (strain CSF55) TaxID=988480 RepID=A0A4V1IYZ8_ROZAC|nr:hypothetical protein ROZALSC1DRAFT_25422 [Rozella allomycis CSF55]
MWESQVQYFEYRDGLAATDFGQAEFENETFIGDCDILTSSNISNINESTNKLKREKLDLPRAISELGMSIRDGFFAIGHGRIDSNIQNIQAQKEQNELITKLNETTKAMTKLSESMNQFVNVFAEAMNKLK